MQTRPDFGQMALVGLQLPGRRVELALLRGEFVLDRLLLLAQVGDFAEHRVDRAVLFGDRVGQRAFVFPQVGELALGGVVLLLQRLRGRSRAAGCQQAKKGEEQRRRQQQPPGMTREGHRRRRLAKSPKYC